MNESHSVYIALGSNQGDRLKNLQLAVDQIFLKLGKIAIISQVYSSPAVGFTGEDFLNTCLLLETNFEPNVLLAQLLKIEEDLGRARSDSSKYESRPIDLDVLFYDSEIIDTATLKLPHPRLHERQFVLKPLLNIAPNFIHPKLNKSIAQLAKLLEGKPDVNSINTWLKNPSNSYDFGNYSYIAIEGNIGAGKTSLAQLIAKDFNAKLILERFADNPFLPKFYEEPQRYAFTLEMSFLADRYQQISDDLSQLDLFKDFIVSDYDIFKSLIFSKITLHEDEFKLYRKLFYQMYKDFSKPDLYIYLYQSTARLKENIRHRGRDYEQNIRDEYLNKINSGYLEFLKGNTEQNIKIVDITERDFIKNREDYLWLLKEITN